MTALATGCWARRRQHRASAATSPSLLQQPLRFGHNLGFSLDRLVSLWCLLRTPKESSEETAHSFPLVSGPGLRAVQLPWLGCVALFRENHGW